MAGTERELPRQASVVIIGGGIMGVSTAYQLAAAGVTDVVLVDADALGAGSTSKAAGGVRAQFSDPINIRLAQRSLRTFETFAEQFGQEIDFHQVGYLFLLDSPADVSSFEAAVKSQNELGVPSRMISAAEAARLSPLISTDGLLAATFCPTDGYCTPESVVLGYATSARASSRTARSAGSRPGTAASPLSSPRPDRSAPAPLSAPPGHGRARWVSGPGSICR